jgi:hypothetical protein
VGGNLKVTDEMVRDYLQALTVEFQRAEQILKTLKDRDRPWLYGKNKVMRRDKTNLRLLRSIKAEVLWRGVPALALNGGIKLPESSEEIKRAMDRYRAFARGALRLSRLLAPHYNQWKLREGL